MLNFLKDAIFLVRNRDFFFTLLDENEDLHYEVFSAIEANATLIAEMQSLTAEVEALRAEPKPFKVGDRVRSTILSADAGVQSIVKITPEQAFPYGLSGGMNHGAEEIEHA